MSIDERLRDELRRAVELRQLRDDDALDHVRLTHGRHLVQSRVTRQATAAVVVLTLFASVAMVVSWRNASDHAGVAAPGDRFRSTATVRVAPAATSSATISRSFKLADPRALALAPSIRRDALLAADLSPDDSSVDFRATLNPTRDLLSLTATAPSASVSSAVTREWASGFTEARRAEAIQSRRERNLALDRRVVDLHQRLRTVDAELVRIDPATYKGHDLGYHGPGIRPFAEPLVHAPEHGSTHELNLANERVQLLAQLADIGAEYARRQVASDALTPQIFSTVISQTHAVRIDESSPSTAPIFVAWAIGLVVALAAAAVFVYRRRTRASRQVAA